MIGVAKILLSCLSIHGAKMCYVLSEYHIIWPWCIINHVLHVSAA